MKAYVMTVLVVDTDGIGSKAARDAVENAHYRNDCIAPDIIDLKVFGIKEWHDDHPLNGTPKEQLRWIKAATAR